MLPQKSMLEAFKKRIESLGDQRWKCFFGRPDRAMNLENQEIEVYLIGKFSGKSKEYIRIYKSIWRKTHRDLWIFIFPGRG